VACPNTLTPVTAYLVFNYDCQSECGRRGRVFQSKVHDEQRETADETESRVFVNVSQDEDSPLTFHGHGHQRIMSSHT
jgi:hypothetical protein